jgi:hypothetical protein
MAADGAGVYTGNWPDGVILELQIPCDVEPDHVNVPKRTDVAKT